MTEREIDSSSPSLVVPKIDRRALSYSLKIEKLYDDGSMCALFSKGHHSPAEFVAAIRALGEDAYRVADVKHVWKRWELYTIDGEWERCLTGRPQGLRGVFPVTIIEW